MNTSVSRRKRSTVFALGFLLAAVASLVAQEGVGPYSTAIKDTFQARAAYLTRLVTARWQGVVDFKEELYDTAFSKVQVQVEKDEAFFYVTFVNQSKGAYELASLGSAVVQRNYDKVGMILGAKLFLADDKDSYLVAYPKNESTKIDVVVHGVVLKQGITYPSLIYVFVQKPLDTTVAMTKGQFAWDSIFPIGSGDFAGLKAFAASLGESGARSRAFSPLKAANDPAKILTELEKAWGLAAEITKPKNDVIAREADPRKADRPYETFPAWKDGFPAWALGSVIFDAAYSDRTSAYFALLKRADGGVDRLFVVPVFEDGQFKLLAFGEGGAARLDDLAAKAQTVRVFRLGKF
jgi:hypothetical protein